uniref:Polymerase basic protein 2 n=1 Tax=Ornate chorus frog influenza-like virus TaxID=2777033 RepID=A0A866VZE7_9ORTO|nr:polymerase basic 2 [Ornate chorus frog influenza-like virus]
MSFLLTLAKEYKRLTSDQKSSKLLSHGTVSSYTTFKKWTTSRKEKNPSLRMRWAMGSKFPIMANEKILKESGIPEEDEKISLWSKSEDVSKIGMVLASPAAITYWNFAGQEADNSEVIRDVYKSKFDKLERWRETDWGPMTFEMVGRQRRAVDTQPVELKLNQKEIKELIMWTLFPDEANLASAFLQENYSLVENEREKYKGKAINKDVAAFMISKQFSSERRFLPTFGPIRPERMEILHALGGDYWKIDAKTVGNTNEEQKKKDIRAVARKLCLRASIDLFGPREKLNDYIKSVTMKVGSISRPFEEVIVNTDDISPEVTICKACLGVAMGKSMSFGSMALRKIEGEAKIGKGQVFVNLKPLTFNKWMGPEVFYCELSKVSGMFKRDTDGLKWATIGRGPPEIRKELLGHIMIFSRDGRFFVDAPININISHFTTRTGKEIPYQYVLLRWMRDSVDNLDSLLKSRGMVINPIGRFGSGMGVDGTSSTNLVYKDVTIQSTPIDIVESKEKHKVELNESLEAVTEKGTVVASILDVEEDRKETFNDVTFDHHDLAVLNEDEKTGILKIYQGLIKRINAEPDGIPNLITSKRYLELYQLPEVNSAASMIPRNMRGVYSYHARNLIESQMNNNSYSIPEIVKLLPFTWAPKKKGKFDNRFFFTNRTYVQPGINTHLFTFSKADRGKIYVQDNAIKIPLVLGDEAMDTSLAFSEGFVVCESDPRAPRVAMSDLGLVGFGEKVRVFVGQGQEKTLLRAGSKRAAALDVVKNVKRMRRGLN